MRLFGPGSGTNIVRKFKKNEFSTSKFFLSCFRNSDFKEDRKHLRSILNKLNNARSLKELEESLQKVKSENLSLGVKGKINKLEGVVKDQKDKISFQFIELEKLKVEIEKKSIDKNFMNYIDREIKPICEQLLKCDLSHDLKQSIRKLNKQRQASYSSYFKRKGSEGDKLQQCIETVLNKIIQDSPKHSPEQLVYLMKNLGIKENKILKARLQDSPGQVAYLTKKLGSKAGELMGLDTQEEYKETYENIKNTCKELLKNDLSAELRLNVLELSECIDLPEIDFEYLSLCINNVRLPYLIKNLDEAAGLTGLDSPEKIVSTCKNIEENCEMLLEYNLSVDLSINVTELLECVKSREIDLKNLSLCINNVKLVVLMKDLETEADQEEYNKTCENIKYTCNMLLENDLSADLSLKVTELLTCVESPESDLDALFSCIIKVKEGIKSLTSNSNSLPEPPRSDLKHEPLPPPLPPSA